MENQIAYFKFLCGFLHMVSPPSMILCPYLNPEHKNKSISITWLTFLSTFLGIWELMMVVLTFLFLWLT